MTGNPPSATSSPALAAAAAAYRRGESKQGLCDLCGHWSGQLSSGACAPCAEQFTTPPAPAPAVPGTVSLADIPADRLTQFGDFYRAIGQCPPDAAPPPKGERAAFFAPKTDWLPRNEALALALGAAQIAARILDDQRLTVLKVEVVGETAILHLNAAPAQASVEGGITLVRPAGRFGCARMGKGEGAVLVEWPL